MPILEDTHKVNEKAIDKIKELFNDFKKDVNNVAVNNRTATTWFDEYKITLEKSVMYLERAFRDYDYK